MAFAWTYGDWVTLTDDAARLAQLGLHIQELTNHNMKSAGGPVSVDAVPASMIEDLLDRQEKLRKLVLIKTTRKYGGINRVAFNE